MWHSEVGSKRKGVSPGIGPQESFVGRQLQAEVCPLTWAELKRRNYIPSPGDLLVREPLCNSI